MHPSGYGAGGRTQYKYQPANNEAILITFTTHNGVGELDYDADDEIGSSADAVIGLWQSDGEPVWSRDFGNARTYTGRDLTLINNDAVVVVGYGNGNLGGPNLGKSDAYVIAYSNTGKRLWADRFGTPEFDAAEAATTAPNGTTYVTGTINGRSTDVGPNYLTGETRFITAYTPDGQQLWLHQYTANDMRGRAN